MSSDCTEKLNPNRVSWGGVNQGQRLLAGLDPDNVKIIAHEPAHWMVFASRYAKYIRYYNAQHQPEGDWQKFFSDTPAAYLALASIQDVDQYRIQIRSFLNFISDLSNQNDIVGLQQQAGFLFSYIGTLAWQFEQLYQALPGNISLKAILKNYIQSNLARDFTLLIKYYHFTTLNPDTITGEIDITFSTPPSFDILGSDVELFSQIINRPFSSIWTDGTTPWGQWIENLTDVNATGDGSIFGSPLLPTIFERLNHAARHNQFASIFDQFLKTYVRLASESKKELLRLFESNGDFAPHTTLFVTFLRLLLYARDYINTLSKRHLDLYYSEILQLGLRPAQPNHAHILFELAKHADSCLLSKGTLLRGGKDSKGNEVLYGLNEDFVGNKAQVTSFKSVFFYHRKNTDLINAIHDGRLYASPMSDSADGLGEAFTPSNIQWHPFANKEYSGDLLNKIKMPKAKIGFAIASHYLWLKEGERIVTISINQPLDFDDGSLTNEELLLIDTFTVEASGEKGWFDVEVIRAAHFQQNFSLQLKVKGDQPAIIPCTTKVHGTDFPTGLPAIRIHLINRNQTRYRYREIQSIQVASVQIELHVTGMRNLALSNDFGKIDPAKPFQPFGSTSNPGSSFIVGSNEVFQKANKLGSLSLSINWQNAPVNEIVNLRELKNGRWDDSQLGMTLSSTIQFPVSDKLSIPVQFEEDAHYSAKSKSGFAAMSYQGASPLALYQLDILNYIAKKQRNEPADLPGLPVGLMINQITLNYTAIVSFQLSGSEIDFGKRQFQFYHLHPFGYSEAHRVLSGADIPTLLPKFGPAIANNQSEVCDPGTLNSGSAQHAGGTALVHSTLAVSELDAASDIQVPEDFTHEAEFYIGITDLQPPQNISLLFQLAEGSANPKTIKPVDHIKWSFLSNNIWYAFKNEEVQDHTDQLMRSGIIVFSVPKSASSQNTLLPAGNYWIRAAIARHRDESGNLLPTTSDAVCKIIRVAAQATTVTLFEKPYADDFLQSSLPAGSITKLVEPDAAIKKIEQPFASFGGRPQERSSHFYTRVSERLRHKGKAITVWDYERLVLEAFPEIYKVKCLQHTFFVPSDTGFGKYNELAPGHITLIAIPNLRNHNAVDPLRPYVSLGVLNDIHQMLAKRHSCHVELHVHNPVFEPVRVACCVKFYPGIDESFHLRLLKKEMVQHLSPWAFSDGVDINFGGRMYKSSIINFIEERPYVDFVTDVKMYHVIIDSSGQDRSNRDMEEIEASTAISILVAAHTDEHSFSLIPIYETDLAGERCNC